MQNSTYGKYQKMQVETADKGALLLMLYDGLILALKKMQNVLGAETVDQGTLAEEAFRARGILYELMGALDDKHNKELTNNLYSLYEYFLHQVGETITQSDPALLDDVIQQLQELREAWATAVQDNRAEKTYGTDKATASTGEPSKRSEKTITA